MDCKPQIWVAVLTMQRKTPRMRAERFIVQGESVKIEVGVGRKGRFAPRD